MDKQELSDGKMAYGADRAWTVLVIDDNEDDQDFLSQRLKNTLVGTVTIYEVSSLQEALDALEHMRFDVIFLDLGLPDSQGASSIERISNHTPSVPIIVITGSEEEHLNIETIRRGAQDFINKNTIDTAGFLRMVSHAIERHKLFDQTKSLIENNPTALIVVSVDWQIQFCNSAAMSLLSVDDSASSVTMPFSYEENTRFIARIPAFSGEGEEFSVEVQKSLVTWYGRNSFLLTIRKI